MAINYLNVFCDGGARGNPGPAAIGVVIKDENGKVLYGFSKIIGIATNNIAEYEAVIAALTFIQEKGIKAHEYKVHLDSKVVAKQLAREYKVKEIHLQELVHKVRQLENKLDSRISYSTIGRSQNFEADLLLNQALDQTK